MSPRLERLVGALVVFAAVSSCVGVVGYFVVGCGCRANPREAELELKNLTGLVNAYRLDPANHRLPESLEELTRGEAPLMKNVPKDPWGNDYVYETRGRTEFRIVCLGPDGVYGTEDDLAADGELRIR